MLLSVGPAGGPGELRLRFTVDDTGPGVADAERERIFEAFAQADAAHARLGGTGLGLAIARRLAQAMDGEVGVETAARAAAPSSGSRPPSAPAGAAPAAAAGRPDRRRRLAQPRSSARRPRARSRPAAAGAVVAADLAGRLGRLGRAPWCWWTTPWRRRAAGPPPARAPRLVLLAPEERGRIAGYRARRASPAI